MQCTEIQHQADKATMGILGSKLEEITYNTEKYLNKIDLNITKGIITREFVLNNCYTNWHSGINLNKMCSTEENLQKKNLTK